MSKRRNVLGLKLPTNAPVQPLEEPSPDEPVDKSLVEAKINELKNASQAQKEQLLDFVRERADTKLSGNSDLIELGDLGKGNSGEVFKVQHKSTKRIMARKKIHLEVKPEVIRQILREMKILQLCASPYIVEFWGVFYEEPEIYICMEYMNGGSLDRIMNKSGRIPEKILSRIALGVLKALDYLKTEQGIIHRDVKPSNILVNMEGQIKLCDFGVSGNLVDSFANSFVGTRSYMSPERLSGGKYTIMSDIWSLGLSLVEMAYGKYPLPVPSPEEQEQLMTCVGPQPKNKEGLAIFQIVDLIVEQPLPTLPSKYFSLEFCEFVDNCLVKNPDERAKLDYFMNHSFVKSEDNPMDIAPKDFIDWICNWISKHGNDTKDKQSASDPGSSDTGPVTPPDLNVTPNNVEDTLPS